MHLKDIKLHNLAHPIEKNQLLYIHGPHNFLSSPVWSYGIDGASPRARKRSCGRYLEGAIYIAKLITFLSNEEKN